MNPTKITIEYCGSWFYGRQAKKVENYLKKYSEEKNANFEISSFEGRKRSFEVVIKSKSEINDDDEKDHVIFSKLQSDGFPDEKSLLQAVDDFRTGEKEVQCTETSIACMIL